MTHDYLRRRIVHPVYLVGIALVLLMKFGRGWIRGTQAWNDLTGWLAAFYV
jgi:hypothetical protein